MLPKMLLRFFCLLYIVILCKEVADAKSVRKQAVAETSIPASSYDAYDFVDNYNASPRIYPVNGYQQKSNPTTPRPFISYLQNVMRNVRLAVPQISWNVTNPLANLFNPILNHEQPIETVQTENYNGSNSQQRQKQQRRRKNAHKKRYRKNKHPMEEYVEQQQLNEVYPEEPQMVLEPYAHNLDPNAAVYFYDPNTDAYYSVQRINAMGSYMEDNYYQPEVTSNYVEAASGKAKPKVAITVPLVDENMNTDDEQTATSDDYDTEESDINLDEEDIDLDQMELPLTSENGTPKNVFINEGLLDDHYNRQRQHAKNQRKKNFVHRQKPRNRRWYFFLLNRN